MIQIIFTGLSSGKTSIKKVIFDKIPPHEVELNKEANQYYNSQIYSFGYCKFNITEFPSSFSFEKNFKESEIFLIKCDILIFVIDYKKYNLSTKDQTEFFKNNILPIINKYKKIYLYIFIHNIDNYNTNNILQSQYNDEIQNSIINTYSEYNESSNIGEFKKKFFKTSIYNSTLYEAFSSILQNTLIQYKNISILIEEVCKNSHMDSTYLFDINNKFCLAYYINTLKKINMFDICLNMIDFAVDIGNIYEDNENKNNDNNINENFDEDLDYSLEMKNFKNGLPDSRNIVFFKYIYKNLALISIINKEKYERNHLIEHNNKEKYEKNHLIEHNKEKYGKIIWLSIILILNIILIY